MGVTALRSSSRPSPSVPKRGSSGDLGEEAQPLVRNNTSAGSIVTIIWSASSPREPSTTVSGAGSPRARRPPSARRSRAADLSVECGR